MPPYTAKPDYQDEDDMSEGDVEEFDDDAEKKRIQIQKNLQMVSTACDSLFWSWKDQIKSIPSIHGPSYSFLNFPQGADYSKSSI